MHGGVLKGLHQAQHLVNVAASLGAAVSDVLQGRDSNMEAMKEQKKLEFIQRCESVAASDSGQQR
jgi:hypothetical protein